MQKKQKNSLGNALKKVSDLVMEKIGKSWFLKSCKKNKEFFVFAHLLSPQLWSLADVALHFHYSM